MILSQRQFWGSQLVPTFSNYWHIQSQVWETYPCQKNVSLIRSQTDWDCPLSITYLEGQGLGGIGGRQILRIFLKQLIKSGSLEHENAVSQWNYRISSSKSHQVLRQGDVKGTQEIQVRKVCVWKVPQVPLIVGQRLWVSRKSRGASEGQIFETRT